MLNLETKQEITRFVLCRAATQDYALEMAEVNSIQRIDRLQMNTEGSSPAGWFISRSGEIPVYDLARVLEFGSTKRSTRSRVLIMNPKGDDLEFWGLLVEGVSDLFSVDAGQISEIPGHISNRYGFFKHTIRNNDRLILQLNPKYLRQVEEIPLEQLIQENLNSPSAIFGIPGRKRTSLTSHQLVLFSISGTKRLLNFAVSSTQVLEILSPQEISPIPGSPKSVEGYINWREMAIPVVNLPACLGIPQLHPPRKSRLVILWINKGNGTGGIYGVYTDPGIRILNMPIKYRVAKADRYIPEQFITGTVEIENRITMIPNLEQIFAAV